MQKINPWTGKQKVKTDGKFLSILTHHYPHLEPIEIKKDYHRIATLIQAPKNQESEQKVPKQYQHLFQIKKKIKQIDKIQQWIDKLEEQNKRKQQEPNMGSSSLKKNSVGSNFVYLPIYSGNVLQEIIRESSTLHLDSLIQDRHIKQIQREIQEMRQILQTNDKVLKKLIF